MADRAGVASLAESASSSLLRLCASEYMSASCVSFAKLTASLEMGDAGSADWSRRPNMNPAAVSPEAITKVAAQSIFFELDRRDLNKPRPAVKSLGMNDAPSELELIPIALSEGETPAARGGDEAGDLGASEGIAGITDVEAGAGTGIAAFDDAGSAARTGSEIACWGGT